MCNPTLKTYYGDFITAQSMAMLEGILTCQSALLGTTGMRMFIRQAIKETRDECRAKGFIAKELSREDFL